MFVCIILIEEKIWIYYFCREMKVCIGWILYCVVVVNKDYI